MIRLLDERSLLKNRLDVVEMQQKLNQLHSHGFLNMEHKLKIQELEAKCNEQERQLRLLLSQVSSGKVDFKSILHSQQVQIRRLTEENMAIKSVVTNRFVKSDDAIFTAFLEQKDLICELNKEFAEKSSELEKALLQIEILRQETLDHHPRTTDDKKPASPVEDTKVLNVLVLLSVKNLVLQKALEECRQQVQMLSEYFGNENSLRLSEHRKGLDSTSESKTKYLGILEIIDVERFTLLLITNMAPYMLEGLSPRLPAYLITMALLYYDYVEDATQLNHLVHLVSKEIRNKFAENEIETILQHYSPQENYEEKISVEFFQSLRQGLLKVRSPTDLKCSFSPEVDDPLVEGLRLEFTSSFKVNLAEVMIPLWLKDYVQKL
ncbi:unnamed protein product [Soboliphyme baturini]|uniref:FRIGIDA-like protein n=1 Tax=Soboliphyme baturini TaxID=241478 RepID=A0A183J3G6_9BILA|nr:unnamed protein product [Soboliphyme baturini]